MAEPTKGQTLTTFRVGSVQASSNVLALQLTIIAAITFVVLLGALHFLNPDLEPSWRVISEYALGPYGWLMRVAFVCLAASCLALVVGIRPHMRSLAGRIGLAFLVVSAAGMLIAAAFTTDPITTNPEARTSTGKLHEIGAMLDVTPVAAVLIAWSLGRRNPAWSSARRVLYLTTALTSLALLAFFITLGVTLSANNGTFGPEVPIGWPNRLMVLTYCIWLVATAKRAIKLVGQLG